MAYADNVQFIKQRTDNKRTVFTIQYDRFGKTYRIDIPLDMKTEVSPAEVEEDIALAIDDNPHRVMELLKEYYDTDANKLVRLMQEQSITHNAEKEIEKKPWKDLKMNPKNMYLSAFGWDYNKVDKISALQVILRNKITDETQSMLYKYPRGGYDPELPSYLTLNDIRKDIYQLRDAGQYSQAHEYFKQVFKKDPLTGQDI